MALPRRRFTAIKVRARAPVRLADFKAGEVRVLVATDIAARGLDIEQLPHVVNYELPNVPEDYVHRIGRTGRAGASGEAISLVSSEERKLLLDIERLMKRKVDVLAVPQFERSERKAAEPSDDARRQQPRPQQQRRPQQGNNPRPRSNGGGNGGNSTRPRGNSNAAKPANGNSANANSGNNNSQRRRPRPASTQG